jgi:hypothetical protein
MHCAHSTRRLLLGIQVTCTCCSVENTSKYVGWGNHLFCICAAMLLVSRQINSADACHASPRRIRILINLFCAQSSHTSLCLICGRGALARPYALFVAEGPLYRTCPCLLTIFTHHRLGYPVLLATTEHVLRLYMSGARGDGVYQYATPLSLLLFTLA